MRATIYIAASALAALACTSTKSKPTSTVEGRIDSSTFALGAPTAVDAIDETGARTHTPIASDGAFRITIAKGHVYRLVALAPKGEEPLVFPRTGGRLDRSFRISSGAAVVALGSVRHFEKAPATFSVNDDGKTSCEGGGDGAGVPSDGECENGKDAKTGLACSDDDQGGDSADPAQPMAVPDKNPPNDVAGCDDGEADGESDD